MGAPNVGKSSIVRVVSSGTPEVRQLYTLLTMNQFFYHVIFNPFYFLLIFSSSSFSSPLFFSLFLLLFFSHLLSLTLHFIESSATSFLIYFLFCSPLLSSFVQPYRTLFFLLLFSSFIFF